MLRATSTAGERKKGGHGHENRERGHPIRRKAILRMSGHRRECSSWRKARSVNPMRSILRSASGSRHTSVNTMGFCTLPFRGIACL